MQKFSFLKATVVGGLVFHPAASEGSIANGFWTLGAEGLLSGGEPTIFFRALKVGK